MEEATHRFSEAREGGFERPDDVAKQLRDGFEHGELGGGSRPGELSLRAVCNAVGPAPHHKPRLGAASGGCGTLGRNGGRSPAG